MVNQAITSLEIVAVPNAAPNPPANNANEKAKFFSIPRGTALTRIAIEVIVIVIGAMAIFLLKNNLGIHL